MDVVPFAETLPEVVSVPKSSVEHFRQTLFPRLGFLFGKRAFLYRLYRLVIYLSNGFDILGRTCAAFDFEHFYAGGKYLVDEAHGAEVFGRHYVFVFYVESDVRLAVFDGVGTAAHLQTRSTVGAAAEFVKAEVAFARNSHTERTVHKHLYAYKTALGSADILLANLLMDICHLVESEFPGKHHHVAIFGKEFHSLNVADVQLCGCVYLYALLQCVFQNCCVGSDYCGDVFLFGKVDYAVHLGYVAVVHYGVDGEIRFYIMLLA